MIRERPAILPLSDCFQKTGMIQFIIAITERRAITARSSWLGGERKEREGEQREGLKVKERRQVKEVNG